MNVVTSYQQLKSFSFEKAIHLENAIIHKDRVTITFSNGNMYFSAPVAGMVRGAVFVGYGMLQAPAPSRVEQERTRRLLKSDDVSSDFRTAVLRFTDDTAEQLMKTGSPATSLTPPIASRLAAESDSRLLRQTGMNISSRQLESILNQEPAGVFLIDLDGGARGRFTYLFDPQARIPTSVFNINAGEKGIIFGNADYRGYDVWMAFAGRDDYAAGRAPYSDVYNLVKTDKYSLTLDLMDPKRLLELSAKLDLVSSLDGLEAIPFAVGEGLGIVEDERRKKQLYIFDAQMSDGLPLIFFQEPWESGFTVVLPQPIARGQHLSINLKLRGDFMKESDTMADTYFPLQTISWYPRHGYANRATFDISMIHRKHDRVASIGELVNDVPVPGNKNAIITKFHMDDPVSFATFAVGRYEIHKDTVKQVNRKDIPLEFYSMPSGRAVIKEDFILAEMSNSLRFFSQIFGDYPYPVFRGVYHPFDYGQGFPTTIMIPATDSANYRTYSFIAHETSHQWWGDMVLWRSYRDQWLSEGFAEYSGMLYAQARAKTSSEKNLIRFAREELKLPPVTLRGIGQGRLEDVGPLLMGHRVESRETGGAYSALTYAKGALVLRMLHFLFTVPQTGEGQTFFDLMKDFVRRYQGTTASTEQFFAVANEHVGNTELARRFGYTNLNWFYRQWITQTYLPSYHLTYRIELGANGTAVLRGVLSQTGLPEGELWFMPLPLVLKFPGGKMGRTAIAARGPQTPVSIQLPRVPENVELDPDAWVLSEKTSAKRQ